MWDFNMIFVLLTTSVILGRISSLPTSSDNGVGACSMTNSQRFDCYPDKGASKDKCEARGCCWRAPSSSNASDPDPRIPYCYYGTGSVGYKVCRYRETNLGFSLHLCLLKGGPYGSNVKTLRADFNMETNGRLHVKFTNLYASRYEVPLKTPMPSTAAPNPHYKVTYTNETFGFAVTRIATGQTIFNSSVGAFIFSDQFLQLSTLLPSHNLYGLGEHVLGLNIGTKRQTLTLFARDLNDVPGGNNLYGVHPFYMNVENDGSANGVFLLNSNAMDVDIQPTPAITFKTIGGILDFYIFTGPDPNSVISQYTEVIGKPAMPPYWALGFQLCRWGYDSIDHMRQVYDRMRKAKIPFDVQWNDIDYMKDHLDFTYDKKRFQGLPEFVDEVHKNGMKYVLMMDPAISSDTPNYEPYETGVDMGIFIKNGDGSVFQGKVWPGQTAFPDFFHPNISDYWYTHINDFHKIIKYDGLWIDMNEPSNFGAGQLEKGCPSSSYEEPPYLPHVFGGKLYDKTVCMTATQVVNNKGELHYNVHSLYGYSEAVETMKALRKTLGKRTLVISRSSYPGLGVHGGHWLGDNNSEWADLYASIAGMINFNMFGIPLVGSDICGFNGNTNEELCLRWMQLGAFYPFSRNHNTIGAPDQDPAGLGDKVIRASVEALTIRYQLLPYLYTLMYNAHVFGTPVARSLFFNFPKDPTTYSIDSQFMWGDGLLISPVVKKGANSVFAYFPPGRWYEFYQGGPIDSKGEYRRLPADLVMVNLHVKGGAILPYQGPLHNTGVTTTTQSRKYPWGAIAALDEDGNASGSLFSDDGESFLVDGLTQLYSVFKVAKNKFYSTPSGKYKPENLQFVNLLVLGVYKTPKQVTVNGVNHIKYVYDTEKKVLLVGAIENVQIWQSFVIEWVDSQ